MKEQNFVEGLFGCTRKTQEYNILKNIYKLSFFKENKSRTLGNKRKTREKRLCFFCKSSIFFPTSPHVENFLQYKKSFKMQFTKW